MKSLWKKLAVAAAALGASFSAHAEGSDAPKPLPQREKVVVAMTAKVEAYIPMILADRMGEFDKENIDIEYTFAKSSDGIVLLSTGRADVLGGQPSAAVFNAIASGADIRVVAPLFVQSAAQKQGIWANNAFLNGRKFTVDLFKDQTIASAIGLGSTASYFLQTELDKVGLSLKDVKFQTMASPDILVALENGAVNFGYLIDSIWQKADASKVSLAFVQGPEMSAGSWSFGPRLLKERRDVGEAMMRALVRTTRTYLQGDYHKDPEVLKVMVEELQLPEETLQKGVSLTFDPNLYMPADLAARLQKTYALIPEVLSYTELMPEGRVVDQGFIAAAGIPIPAK
ncbi:ABC transporter substrate-binding protein [Aminobacter sp. HY435]|uniref:ABC transporter substrate-binding protein n=1 Tax=Aminobacter sp. HY435 TaxID=2970917 RepID=UPI0022B94DC9|nr:ABC transporter substrate-binding protein [Aminobacter sp. HY435]